MIRFLTILLVLLLYSCVTNKTVYYKTEKIQKNMQPPAKKKSLCVLSFNDIRKDVAGNELYLTQPREIFENGEAYCINSEIHYKKVPLSTQMAAMLADHLFTRQTFKNVVLDNKDSADYVIQCNLARLTAKQHLPGSVRGGAAIGAVAGGAVGGIIGGAVSSFVKSKAFVSIALTEIKVYDKNMNLLIDMESFAKDFEYESNPDSNCWCSYENVKNKLKVFYTELVYQIENRIEELN
jgi:hypothetical protein